MRAGAGRAVAMLYSGRDGYDRPLFSVRSLVTIKEMLFAQNVQFVIFG